MQQCLDFMWALEVQAYTLLFAQQVLLLTAIFPDPPFLFLMTEVGVAGHLLSDTADITTASPLPHAS